METVHGAMVVIPCRDRLHAVRAFGVEEDKEGLFWGLEVSLGERFTVREAKEVEFGQSLHLAVGDLGKSQLDQ